MKEVSEFFPISLIVALLLFLREIYYTTSFIKVKKDNVNI
jgi:hypothetical protein